MTHSIGIGIGIGIDGPVINPADDFDGGVQPVGGGSEFRVRTRTVQMVHPLGDRLVVRPDPAEETIGSLVVPDTALEKPSRGTIVAIGPMVNSTQVQGSGLYAVFLQIGDRVIYGDFTGADVMHDGESCKLLRSEDLFGLVSDREL